MKLVAQATDDLAVQINNKIESAMISAMAEIGFEVDDAINESTVLEYKRAVGEFIRLITVEEDDVDFAAVHSLNQIGRLTPDAIAAAPGNTGSVLVLSDSSAHILHDPRLRHLVESNAAGIINSLGLGVWTFEVDRTRALLRLRLLNPRMVGGSPAEMYAVNTGRFVVDREWADQPDGSGIFFVRPRDHKTAMTLMEVEV